MGQWLKQCLIMLMEALSSLLPFHPLANVARKVLEADPSAWVSASYVRDEDEVSGSLLHPRAVPATVAI